MTNKLINKLFAYLGYVPYKEPEPIPENIVIQYKNMDLQRLRLSKVFDPMDIMQQKQYTPIAANEIGINVPDPFLSIKEEISIAASQFIEFYTTKQDDGTFIVEGELFVALKK